ncbi:MAG: hypothetical protein JRF07_03670 [Deltaproteobacteria bacterium]|jgi:hypothetical protein|nr:hypothetical protein [Deltaproteobacteria bacterium]MBW2477411.1 hypothetical protein [Deltaproteobacteria bacterium]MBW2519405.1 hypothetical protein [Deltaproteobacteria bacterium]
MTTCPYFEHCEFVLRYVARVKPHWDDFINHYCQGELREFCKRLEWFQRYGTKPPAELMPTGQTVPESIERQR